MSSLLWEAPVLKRIIGVYVFFIKTMGDTVLILMTDLKMMIEVMRLVATYRVIYPSANDCPS